MYSWIVADNQICDSIISVVQEALNHDAVSYRHAFLTVTSLRQTLDMGRSAPPLVFWTPCSQTVCSSRFFLFGIKPTDPLQSCCNLALAPIQVRVADFYSLPSTITYALYCCSKIDIRKPCLRNSCNRPLKQGLSQLVRTLN